MLTVYTRHHPDCKNSSDKTWRCCNFPEWIWGSLNGKLLRQSARTHSWEVAEELRRQLIEGAVLPGRPAAETQPIPVATAPVPVQARVHPSDSAEEINPVQPRKARVMRSSRAPVRRSEPKTSVHSSKGRLLVISEEVRS